MLNRCISALWDDVRRELDENVIPGKCVEPGGCSCRIEGCRMVTSCVFASRMFNAYP